MKYFWIILAAVLVIGGGSVWYNYYFVFGEGVKSGVLNYAVKKPTDDTRAYGPISPTSWVRKKTLRLNPFLW